MVLVAHGERRVMQRGLLCKLERLVEVILWRGHFDHRRTGRHTHETVCIDRIEGPSFRHDLDGSAVGCTGAGIVPHEGLKSFGYQIPRPFSEVDEGAGAGPRPTPLRPAESGTEAKTA